MNNSYVQNRQQPRLEVLYEIAEILNMEVKDILIERKEKKIIWKITVNILILIYH